MQTLLSENWHSVRWLKPRLRDGVRVYQRVFRGKVSVLLFDPLAHRFHRLSPEAYKVVEFFDGSRTLEEIWEQSALAVSDPCSGARAQESDAIGQQELVQLLSQLYSGDLLQTQVTPDAMEVLERYDRQRRMKIKQIFMNPLSVKFPLFHPEPWLAKQAAFARLLFSPWVGALWLLLVLPAALLAGVHWDALTENLSDRVLSAQNLLLVWLTYPVVKGVHEWAHALAVKAWGGKVREVGLMFLVFTPVPYVDATESYGFSSKWQRAAVAGAGILAELLLGAIAMYVWVLAEPGWVRALAYNVILIAGVSTLLVNGNPLMRYDGYFVLSDLLEIPNLAQRSTKYWSYLSDRFLFRSRDAKPPHGTSGEAVILFVYGGIAPIYRLFISLGLAWFIAQEYFFFGVLMAVAGLWSALVQPVWKCIKHLRESPTLGVRRPSAVRLSVALTMGTFLLLVAVPVPFYSVAEGVLWVPEKAVVRARADGHLGGTTVSGTQLLPGDTIAVLDNPELVAQAEVSRASVAELAAQLRQHETAGSPVEMEGLRRKLQAEQQKSVELQRRLADLTLVSTERGTWIFALRGEPDGQYVKRGQTVGYVASGPSRTVRAAIAQEDIDLVRQRHTAVQVRSLRRPWAAVEARVVGLVPAGHNELVSAALGTSGGGTIAVDPSSQDGTQALDRVFDFELELAHGDGLAVFGDRVAVRFDLGTAPLAMQWYLRVRQTFLARLNV